MDGRTLTIVLRLFHVVGGLFWVGSAVVVAWFLLPAQRAIRGPVMREVMGRLWLGMWMGIAVLATLVSGFVLYGRNVEASAGTWAGTPAGIGYGIGAAAALLATIVGLALGMGTGRRLARLVEAVQQAGGAPDAAQSREMERLQRRAARTAQLAAILLLVAAAAMATARYW